VCRLMYFMQACPAAAHLPGEIAQISRFRIRHEPLNDARLPGVAPAFARVLADFDAFPFEPARHFSRSQTKKPAP
jgi:hypothetical protein